MSRSIATGSVLPEARTAYGEHYHRIDYVLEAVEKSPVGLIRGGQSLVALQTRSEFHADFMRPYEVDPKTNPTPQQHGCAASTV